MVAISFQFAESVSKPIQDEVLKKIRQWTGVKHVGPIDPATDDELVARMCMAETQDGPLVDHLIDDLRRLPGIQDVATTPTRQLI